MAAATGERLHAIYSAVALSPVPLSTRELMVVAGLHSTNWTHVQIRALIQAKLLVREPRKGRTLQFAPCDGHRWMPTTVNGRDAIIARLDRP